MAPKTVRSQAKKAPPTRKSEPLFPLLGKERVKFVRIARDLSEVLVSTYGDQVSISKFEKILGEIRGREDLREKLDISQFILDKYQVYLAAKSAMIEEQNLLKNSFATPIVDLEQSLKVEDLFRGNKTVARENSASGETLHTAGSGPANTQGKESPQ